MKPSKGTPPPKANLCLVQLSGLPGGAKLKEALRTFSRCDSLFFKSNAELLTHLSPSWPAVVVLPALGLDPQSLDCCVGWLRDSGVASGLVLVDGAEANATAALASRLRGLPGVRLIPQAPPLEARLVEAVLVGLGIPPRVHVRSEALITGTLEASHGRFLKFELLNFSESGAKLRVGQRLEMGEPVILRFELDGRAHEVEAVPMRLGFQDEQRHEVGVQFEEPSDALTEAIRKVVRAESEGRGSPPAPARAPRQQLAKLVKVGVRVQRAGSARRDYLVASDVSASGLRAVGPRAAVEGAGVGDRLELLLTWRGQSLQARGTIIRVQPAGEESALGIQFDGMTHAGRTALALLLRAISEQSAGEVLRLPRERPVRRPSSRRA